MKKTPKIKFVNCPNCGMKVEGVRLGQHIGADHADVAWRIYAQIYLEKMWFGQGELDKQLVARFNNPVTSEMLYDLFSPSKYGVARTVPGNGPGKYQKFAEMLNAYRETEITREIVPDIIERELANMRETYGKGPLSAITKALWMMKQHPIVIYDTNTWRGLGRRGLAPSYDAYSTYFRAWFRFFDDAEAQKGLDDALTWLPDSPAANRLVVKYGEAVRAEIRTLAASPLMRNRVVDMRLFYEGGGYLEESVECVTARQ